MLTQNDPFRSIDQWLNAFNSRSWTDSTAPIDAYRRGENVWVHMDLPGVAADSLDIDVERNNITITAERSFSREEGDQIYFAERPQGKFRRQVNLGDGLDAEAIEADYHNGVLTLRVPVAEKAKARKIAINTVGSESDSSAIEAHLADG